VRPGIATENRRIVITGVGVIHADDRGISGLRAPPDPPPEITAFEVPEDVPAWGFEVLDLPLETELPNIKSFVDRTSALALLAARRALLAASLLDPAARPAGVEIGCAYGSMLGCLEAMGIFWNKVKTSNPKFAQPLPFTHGYANSPSSLLCIEFGLRGPSATFSGEKLAGMEALLFAFDQIRSGSGSIILAGASESLTPAAFNHLRATGALSIKGDGSDGIVPGEGAAMLVLESEECAINRGAKILCELDSVCLYGTSKVPIGHETPVNPSLRGSYDITPSVRGSYGDTLSVAPLMALVFAARMFALSDNSNSESIPLSASVDDPRAGRAAAFLKKL